MSGIFPEATQIEDEIDAREKENPLLKLAVKAANKSATYILKKVLLANGISPKLAGPLSGYYSEHVRLMVHLIDIQLATNRYWELLTELRHELESYSDELDETMTETPFPQPVTFSPSVMPLLLLPGVGQRIQAEWNHYHELVETVVAGLDARIRDTIEIFERILAAVKWVNQSILKPHGNLELSTGIAGLISARTDLAYAENKVEKRYQDLVNHRNDWAKRVSLSEWHPRVNFSALENELFQR